MNSRKQIATILEFDHKTNKRTKKVNQPPSHFFSSFHNTVAFAALSPLHHEVKTVNYCQPIQSLSASPIQLALTSAR